MADSQLNVNLAASAFLALYAGSCRRARSTGAVTTG